MVVHQARGRAGIERRADEAAGVVRIAGPGEEGVPRAHLAMVGVQSPGDARAEPVRRGIGMGEVLQGRHRKP